DARDELDDFGAVHSITLRVATGYMLNLPPWPRALNWYRAIGAKSGRTRDRRIGSTTRQHEHYGITVSAGRPALMRSPGLRAALAPMRDAPWCWDAGSAALITIACLWDLPSRSTRSTWRMGRSAKLGLRLQQPASPIVSITK